MTNNPMADFDGVDPKIRAEIFTEVLMDAFREGHVLGLCPKCKIFLDQAEFKACHCNMCGNDINQDDVIFQSRKHMGKA